MLQVIFIIMGISLTAALNVLTLKCDVCSYIRSIPTKVMHIGKKTTLLHSPEFFSLYRRHMELSQKIYASS